MRCIISELKIHVEFIERNFEVQMNSIELAFNLQKTKSLLLKKNSARTRIEALKKLKVNILKSQTQIEEALFADFKKAPVETLLTEVYPVVGELDQAIRKIKKWMRPIKVSAPFPLWGTKSEIHYEPKGLCLIISPWNYPFQLAMAPLVAAIAAGNSVILKPSELTPNTSALIEKICLDSFASDLVQVFQGDKSVAEQLLKLPFHHIFFTGSPKVGTIVMKAAAENLASVTLELGGKSPAIIDASADLKLAAQKVAWGKSVNAGQTCVAPDYILVEKTVLEPFKKLYREALHDFYGDKAQESSDLAAIISAEHLLRLQKLNSPRSQSSNNQKMGSEIIEFRSLAEVEQTKPAIMSEEIFGPPLPVIPFEDLNEAILYINKHDKPLVLYLFSKNKKIQDRIIQGTSSGGVLINDVLIHLLNHNLPFGGANHSGLGNYHGYFGFKSFSHEKSVMRQGFLGRFLKVLYPPYTESKRKIAETLIRLQ